MRKKVLIVVNIVLVAAIALSAFYLVKVLQNRKLTDFIKEKQTQIASKSSQDKQEGNIGNSYVTAYFPKDTDGKRIELVEDMIYQNIGKDFGSKKPDGNIKELVFISATDTAAAIPTVHKMEVSSQHYKVAGFKISEKAGNNPQTILLTADNQQFTFASLFSDLEKARQIIADQIKSDLEAKQVSKEEVSSYLSAFEQLDLKDLEFSYEQGKLNLVLAENQVGLSELSLEISKFFDTINSQYLFDGDLPAYQAYQAEKAEKLKKSRERMVALTFDDGPSPTTTPQLLDILKKYNVKATFFLLGQNIEGNEAILKRMVDEGHELANHSWSHPNLVTLSADQVKQEIEQTQSAIEKVTGKRPVMVRPPYGSVNQMVMDAMQLPAMYWSVDSLDWESRNPQAILKVIEANTVPGSIILMHDIHQPTVDSIERVVQYLQSQDYTFGTLTDMLGEDLNPQHVYYDSTSSRPAQ